MALFGVAFALEMLRGGFSNSGGKPDFYFRGFDFFKNFNRESKIWYVDFKNGVIVKIYKSYVDPILDGGRLRRKQTKMGISSGPMTLKFKQSPHFQNREFEKEFFF